MDEDKAALEARKRKRRMVIAFLTAPLLVLAIVGLTIGLGS